MSAPTKPAADFRNQQVSQLPAAFTGCVLQVAAQNFGERVPSARSFVATCSSGMSRTCHVIRQFAFARRTWYESVGAPKDSEDPSFSASAWKNTWQS